MDDRRSRKAKEDKGRESHSNYEKKYSEDKRKSHQDERYSSKRPIKKESRSEDYDVKLDRLRGSKRKMPNENGGKEPKWGKESGSSKEMKVKVEKEEPNFQTTGKLTQDANTYKGVVIKYTEPEEARKPKRRWRLYPFKGEKQLPVLYIHRQSGYLLGRDRKIADIPIDHPSCSKQHAALQYRLVSYKDQQGRKRQKVRPYLMDLESANGTYINNKKIDPGKYYELLEKDVVKFGYSTREYVLLHEHSQDSDEDDDIGIPEDA